MTSVVGTDSRLRRTMRSIPGVGRALRSAAISYYQGRADLENGYRDLKSRRLPAIGDTAAVTGGTWLAKGARRLLLLPYRQERVEAPSPLSIGGRSFDIVSDLAEFTALPEESVRALVSRRIEDFRTEWLQWPETLRSDGWFYLSSRLYLFANAVHFHDAPELIDDVAGLLPAGAHVLDYGGGTGNLSLALAALGFDIDYRELSALQKDFVRFRRQRYGLEDRLEVLDSWAELPSGAYDAVLAFDVLEHVPDLAHVVARIAETLKKGGLLVDTSSFSVGLANPMHHEDPGLEALLAEHGVVLDRNLSRFRVWTKRS